MLEHIVTDTLEYTLSNENHHSGIDKGSNYTQCKNTAKYCKCFIKFCEIRICLSDQRNDKIIQQEFQGQRYCNTCYGTDKDADKYNEELLKVEENLSLIEKIVERQNSIVKRIEDLKKLVDDKQLALISLFDM